MSNPFIKFAVISGELSPSIQGRSDLEKYDMGMSQIYNWIVGYHGGMFTRPGTQFCEIPANDHKTVKLFKFIFSANTANTYILVFTDLQLRFIQDGSYVLETAQAITGIAIGATTVLTVVAHGKVAGDWVWVEGIVGPIELNSRYFKVKSPAANTFEITDLFDVPISTSIAWVSGGTVERVYTVTTPYAAADLLNLRYDQVRDTVRLTHPNFKPRDLVRAGHASWSLAATVIENNVVIPSNLSYVRSDPGTSKVAYAVTTFDKEKGESLCSPYLIISDTEDFTITAGSITVRWDPVAKALFYNVYRSILLSSGAQVITRAQEVGYVGRAYGPEFGDYNIIPDFVKTPPQHFNPFNDGVIEHIDVTAKGTGFSNTTSVVSIADPTGTGFIGYAVVESFAPNGVVAIVVVNGGKNYTAPVVSVSIGAGATFVATVSPLSGNNPAISGVFQQRQLFAATDNFPLTIWGSKPGKFTNFDTSLILTQDDSYEHEVDSTKVAKIKHMLPTRGGLLVMSPVGVWQLTGTQGGPVTATNALAENQSYSGVSDTPPLRIDTDVLYVEDKAYTVRLLNYKDFYKVYRGEDVSVLSSHFFSKDRQIQHMDYSAAPYRCVFAQRSDGCLLAFTLLREQNVYAWSQLWTQGLFKDCVEVEENGLNVIYVVVERLLDGRVTKVIERFVFREIQNIEDAWCLDCALELGTNPQAGTLQVVSATGKNILATSNAAIFNPDSVGKIIHGGGGIMRIVDHMSDTQVQVDIIRPITRVWPESIPASPLLFTANDWTLDTPQTEAGGLWHLEGMTVGLVGDGFVLPDQVVTGGKVIGLPDVTRLLVGLRYQCRAQTLPLAVPDAVIQHRVKRVVGATVNQLKSRGLKVGRDPDKLYPFKERTTEAYGDPIALQNGPKSLMIDPKFTKEGYFWFVQDEPLPAHVTMVVLDVEVGDDQD